MASLNVQPYLFFEGRCEEALEFYRRTLGAEVLALMRSKDSPDPAMTIPDGENKIIHAMFRVGETIILASDGRRLPSRSSATRTGRRSPRRSSGRSA